MAATILSKSGVTLLFGIEAGIAAISGMIVTNSDTGSAGKELNLTHTDGSIGAAVFYDRTSTQKFSALLESGTTLPFFGQTVSVGGVLYIANNISKKETNNGFTIVSMDLKAYPDSAIP